MNAKAILTIGLSCFLLAFLITTFVSPIYAAPLKPDPDAPKTGLAEVFKSRKATGVGPNGWQLALTFGATAVMIGCVKYL